MMSQQYSELDTLRSFLASINRVIDESIEPSRLADLLVQNKIITQFSARDIVSPPGLSSYIKISKLVNFVFSRVQTVASQGEATKVFNIFVLILYNDLQLQDLSLRMVEHCAHDNPTYINPIDSAAKTGDDQAHLSIDIMKERPKLLELKILKHPHNEKKVEIIRSIAGDWKNFGVHLEFDDTGDQLKILETRSNPMDASLAMFQHWLNGNGVKATWGNLIEILRDFEKSILADDLKEILEHIYK